MRGERARHAQPCAPGQHHPVDHAPRAARACARGPAYRNDLVSGAPRPRVTSGLMAKLGQFKYLPGAGKSRIEGNMRTTGSEHAALELGGAPRCPYARALVQLRERRLRRNVAGSISSMLLKELINDELEDGVVHLVLLGGRQQQELREVFRDAVRDVLHARVERDARSNVDVITGWSLVRARTPTCATWPQCLNGTRLASEPRAGLTRAAVCSDGSARDARTPRGLVPAIPGACPYSRTKPEQTLCGLVHRSTTNHQKKFRPPRRTSKSWPPT